MLEKRLKTVKYWTKNARKKRLKSVKYLIRNARKKTKKCKILS